jgi:hypothetical protein
MRLVIATLVMVVGVVVATASTALALDESAAPGASVEPAASGLPDAFIDLRPSTELEPLRTWAIAVTGGRSSVEVLGPDDVGSGIFVTVVGQSATVEMTATLPRGWQLTSGECFDAINQLRSDVLVPPDQLVLEVVQGGSYSCEYGSAAAGSTMHAFPITSTEPTGPTGPSVAGWLVVLGVLVGVTGASLVLAVRHRRDASVDP